MKKRSVNAFDATSSRRSGGLKQPPGRESVEGHALWSVAGQGFLSGTKFLFLLFVARAVGVDAQGSFAVGVSAAQVLGILASSGMDVANTVFSSRRPSLVRSLTVNSIALTGVVLVASVLVAWPVSMFASAPASTVFAVAILGGLQVGILSLSGCIAGLRRFRLLATVNLLRFLPGLVFVLVWTDHVTVRSAFTAWIAGAVLAMTVATLALAHGGRPRGTSLKLMRLQLSFGLRSQMERVANLLMYRLDLFIVRAVLGRSAAGLYSVAQQGAEFLLLLPRALTPVVLSVVARPTGVRSGVRRVAAGAGAVVVVVAAGVAWYADALVPMVYTSAFEGSVLPLRILLVGVVLISFGLMSSAAIAGRGRPGLTAIPGIAALVVTVVLDSFLLVPFGIPGAAIASSVAYGTYTIISLRLLKMTNPPVSPPRTTVS